jgi:hypothetical protein
MLGPRIAAKSVAMSLQGARKTSCVNLGGYHSLPPATRDQRRTGWRAPRDQLWATCPFTGVRDSSLALAASSAVTRVHSALTSSSLSNSGLDSAILHRLHAERGPQTTVDDVANATFPSIIRLCSPVPGRAHICLPYAERKCPNGRAIRPRNRPMTRQSVAHFSGVHNRCFSSSKTGETVVHWR